MITNISLSLQNVSFNELSESPFSGPVWSERVCLGDLMIYCLETPRDIHIFEMDLGRKWFVIEWFFTWWEKPPTSMRDAPGIE